MHVASTDRNLLSSSSFIYEQKIMKEFTYPLFMTWFQFVVALVLVSILGSLGQTVAPIVSLEACLRYPFLLFDSLVLVHTLPRVSVRCCQESGSSNGLVLCHGCFQQSVLAVCRSLLLPGSVLVIAVHDRIAQPCFRLQDR